MAPVAWASTDESSSGFISTGSNHELNIDRIARSTRDVAHANMCHARDMTHDALMSFVADADTDTESEADLEAIDEEAGTATSRRISPGDELLDVVEPIAEALDSTVPFLDECSGQRNDPMLSLVSLSGKTAPTFDVARGTMMEVMPQLSGPAARTVQFSCGRDARNAIILRDKRVSVRHFVIRVRAQQGGRVLVLDILDMSSNGTWVNGQKVGKDQRVPLAVGDRIVVLPAKRVGRTSELGFMLLHDTRGARCHNIVAAPAAASKGAEQAPKPLPAPLTALEQDLCCGICSDSLYKCLTLVPCGHNYCSMCFVKWRKTSSTCPECRQHVYQAVRNKAVDCMVRTFVKAHPSAARSCQELTSIANAEKDSSYQRVLRYLLRETTSCDVRGDLIADRGVKNEMEATLAAVQELQNRRGAAEQLVQAPSSACVVS